MPQCDLRRRPAGRGPRPRRRSAGRVALKAHGPEILHKTELGRGRGRARGRRRGRAGRGEDGRGASPSRGLERTSFLVQQMVERRRRAAGRDRHRPGLRPGRRLRRGRNRGRAARRRLGPGLPARRRRRRGDGRLARDRADAGRLPRPRLRSTVGRWRTLIARVGALAETHREVVELDLNPVLARPTAPSPPTRESGSRAPSRHARGHGHGPERRPAQSSNRPFSSA